MTDPTDTHIYNVCIDGRTKMGLVKSAKNTNNEKHDKKTNGKFFHQVLSFDYTQYSAKCLFSSMATEIAKKWYRLFVLQSIFKCVQ